MKILIFGAGAVGMGIVNCLIESGADVVLVARPDTQRYLEKHGLRRTGTERTGTTRGFLKDFYDQMVPATYAHYSLMLQDLKASRRTEIDAMSGAVVELGERFGMPTPLNKTMRDLVRFKEAEARLKEQIPK